MNIEPVFQTFILISQKWEREHERYINAAVLDDQKVKKGNNEKGRWRIHFYLINTRMRNKRDIKMGRLCTPGRGGGGQFSEFSVGVWRSVF